MLTQTDVCPSCGQVHPEGLLTLRSRSGRECPAVLHGTFPIITRPLDQVGPPNAQVSALGPQAVYPGSLPIPKSNTRRFASLPIPILLPAELEDHF